MANLEVPSLEEQLGIEAAEIIKMYDGKVELFYADGPHEYWRIENGKRIDIESATTILDKVLDKSAALMGWQTKIYSEYIRKTIPNPTYISDVEGLIAGMKKSTIALKYAAGDIGKEAHKWFERYWKYRIKGGGHHTAIGAIGLPEDSKVRNCVESGLSWFQQHMVTALHLETKVYSLEEDVAGTFDGIFLVDGKRTVIDYKTAKGLYPNFRFQTAFYQKAWEEEHPDVPIDQRILLRLGKEEPEFEAHVMDDPEEYWEDYFAFKGSIVVYRRLKAIQAKEKAGKKQRKLKVEGEK